MAEEMLSSSPSKRRQKKNKNRKPSMLSAEIKEALTKYNECLEINIKQTQALQSLAKVMLNHIDLYHNAMEENKELRIANKEFVVRFKEIQDLCSLQPKKVQSSLNNKRTRNQSLLEPPKKRRRKDKP